MRISRLLGLRQAPVFPRTAAVVLLILSCAAGTGLWKSTRIQSTTTLPMLKVDVNNEPTSPYVRLATVSQADHGEGSSRSDAAMAQTPVHVGSLNIISEDLPELDRLWIVKNYQGSTYPLQELTERIQLYGLRDPGYAKGVVKLQPTSGSGPSTTVSVRIAAGSRYTLTAFSVTGATVFSQTELVQQSPLHTGHLFSASAIGKGLESLTKLYRAKGYPEAVTSPRLQSDEVHHTITVILDVDEGKPRAA